MRAETFDWQLFLRRWQEEWVPDKEEEEKENGGEATALGRPGADEVALAAAEERLGRRLPLSYRNFLAASDGWYVGQTAGVYQLGGAADIDWFRDPFDMTPLYEENLDEGSCQEEIRLAGMWQRALRLETDSDMSYALLDPGDVDQDGEWALYVYRGWSGEFPDRYPSFRAYMDAMYRGFHRDRAGGRDFVNATTRAQDAQVKRAHLLALRGRYAEALPLLEEASSFGRPRSADLLLQLRHLSAPRSAPDYGLLVADPRYLPELLPLAAMAQVVGRRRPDGDDHWFRMMEARGVARETAEAVLAALRDGTHRYAPPGPWGRAVAEARESAWWGATDAAWRTLRAALPLWRAPGPSLIAPVGLLADPLLAPLVTPERGREVLATPRSGEAGPAPEPVPDLDPPGLAWLAEAGASRGMRGGYRCVWVKEADPTRLPALIGEESAELSTPTDLCAASRRALRPHEREGVELWEDRAVVAVGRAPGGWAFAFDGRCGQSWSDRSLSLAPAASASGRAVVVWCDPRDLSPDGRPAAFHLSVAENGAERYAFTVRGDEIQRFGEIPEPLDPDGLFGNAYTDTEPERETRVLEALHSHLGLALPRFALTRGRLPTFTTRSWSRAPREGETFGYLCVGSPPRRR